MDCGDFGGWKPFRDFYAEDSMAGCHVQDLADRPTC